MHERNRHNLPTEIIRTLIAISETGSLTKAATQLGLIQPAVSAQMKRIEHLLGGAIFKKSAGGSTATHLGLLVLDQARRMLDANDQMLRLRGISISEIASPIRVGISSLYAEEYLKKRDVTLLSKIIIHAGTSAIIKKQLADAFIDMACIFQGPGAGNDLADCVVDEHDELFVWTRSRDFVISPGSPIPILSCTGAVTDDLMMNSLSRHRLTYRIAFNGADYRATLSAAEAGLGYTVVPRRMIPPTLVEAKDYYLPALPPMRALLYARPDAHRSADAKAVLAHFSEIFFLKDQRISTA